MALSWTRTPVPLALLKAANLFNAGRRLLRGEGPSERPFVLDIGNRRHLFFTGKCVQSSMRVDEPDTLLMPYTQLMMAFLLLNRQPANIVMIGLGGGSLAKFCHRHLPEARITVVEVNARVIALRERFCIPPDSERFRVIHGNGIEHLRGLDPDVDVLLVDACDETGVDPALAGSDFYANAARCLHGLGVFVMNFSGDAGRHPAHFQRIRSAFAGPALEMPVADSDNVILFSGNGDAGLSLGPQSDAMAAALRQQLGLDFERYLALLRTSLASANGPCRLPEPGLPQP